MLPPLQTSGFLMPKFPGAAKRLAYRVVRLSRHEGHSASGGGCPCQHALLAAQPRHRQKGPNKRALSN
jgi:hypothetical protein